MNRVGYTLKLTTLTYRLTLIKRFLVTCRLMKTVGSGRVVHATGPLSRWARELILLLFALYRSVYTVIHRVRLTYRQLPRSPIPIRMILLNARSNASTLRLPCPRNCSPIFPSSPSLMSTVHGRHLINSWKCHVKRYRVDQSQ